MPDTPIWSSTTLLPDRLVPPPVAAGDEPPSHDALPPGTRLDEFEITRVLGAGGFGIVYLALDHVLLRYVAIKEYMPAALAGRGPGATVVVRSPGHLPTYAAGLESFFNEARMLASFDHPSLVKVYRFWKAHNTAYMVMPYYPGRTLREARREMRSSPDETWLRAFVDPLLGALELLHGEDIYHRDIAPDNILLLPDGRPVLLDFGSARQVIGDRTQSLTAILKPNFAPIEQYADEPGMRQGPWTDLYALGATLHFMLTGQVPVPAVLRAVRDTLPALAAADAPPFPGVGQSLLATIDWTLALAPEDRPQGVATMRQALNGETVPPPATPRSKPVAPPATVMAAEPETAAAVDLAIDPTPTQTPTPTPTPTPTRTATLVPATGSARSPTQPHLPAADPSPPVSSPAPQGRGRVIAAGAALALVVAIAAGGKMMFSPPLANASSGDVPAAAAPAPVAPEPVATRVAALPAAQNRAIAPAAEPVPAASAPLAASPPAAPTAPAASLPSAVPTASAASAAATAAATRRELAARVAAESRASAARSTLAALPSEPEVRKARPVAETFAALPAPAAAAAAKSPKDLCGDMNFVALALCVSRQCLAPALQAHPQCIEARRYDEQRKRRMED